MSPKMIHSDNTHIYKNEKFKIETSLTIPFNESIGELVHILITKYNLPNYVEVGE